MTAKHKAELASKAAYAKNIEGILMTRVQEIDNLKRQAKLSKSEVEVALQKQLSLEQLIVEKE
jgi:hypothetical protein